MPPLHLVRRVGELPRHDSMGHYERLGRAACQAIEGALPETWSFAGKRVLDFGCGAGRTLRHFADHAAAAEFWGCDIDGPSIEWLQGHLSPPFHVYRNGERPPLPHADGFFDLVYAISVFTHLDDTWSDWLLELDRVLAPGGLLLATFLGPAMGEYYLGGAWDEDRVGMLVLGHGKSWDIGGPMVIHSPWWIRNHWGRLFDVVDLVPRGFVSRLGCPTPPTDPSLSQGMVLLLKKEVGPPSKQDLERPDPDDPRELEAIRYNVWQLQREGAELRRALDTMTASTSWRVTTPLRTVGRMIAACRRSPT